MNLSKRLKAVADLVDTNRVIDVGCDHGYLDIYLTKYNNCKCIATDISDNAIQSCINNISLYNLNGKIDVLVTNGLEGIDVNEQDTIVISGMGTNTIINILTNAKLSDTLIISSNNNLEKLRKFIVSLGYYIDNEVYILEHGIHYVIIKFKKGIKEYNEFDYLIGPIVQNDQKYKKNLLIKYKNLINKIPNKHKDLKKRYKDIINYLEKI